MKVTTKSRYALRALLALDNNKDQHPVSIRQIAVNENLSPVFLEQIFSKLKKSEIVVSTRGLKGGFKLNKPLSDITVLEIMTAAGENLNLTPCTECKDNNSCENTDNCVMHKFWQHTSIKLYNYLKSINLEQIKNEDFSRILA